MGYSRIHIRQHLSSGDEAIQEPLREQVKLISDFLPVLSQPFFWQMVC